MIIIGEKAEKINEIETTLKSRELSIEELKTIIAQEENQLKAKSSKIDELSQTSANQLKQKSEKIDELTNELNMRSTKIDELNQVVEKHVCDPPFPSLCALLTPLCSPDDLNFFLTCSRNNPSKRCDSGIFQLSLSNRELVILFFPLSARLPSLCWLFFLCSGLISSFRLLN